jgi:hypothetical protein
VEKPVAIEGQELKLATITVGALESIELSGKEGRKFNIALIALSLLAAGDLVHGTEEWVRSVHVFSPNGADDEDPPFQRLLAAANVVNGFKTPKPGENGPAAPAAE